ncbi:MAG TPA: Crp/Fnr family transcriptional regulator [Thermoanaerobaculia bacterium]|nr:Crp/Fnr family transcriptional regulator [Thermoanaerobaculia bacterium]
MPSRLKLSASPPNLILSSLTSEGSETLRPYHQEIDLDLGQVLFEPEDLPGCVYFPHGQTIISVVRTFPDGSSVEVGLAGFEGLVSLSSVMSSAPHRDMGVVQSPGRASCVDAAFLRSEFKQIGPIHDMIIRYADFFLLMATQNVACNRLHTVQSRLAKWLLLHHDRIRLDTLSVTHEFLSNMLGARRAGVTVALGDLTRDGAISHRRQQVTIRSRALLEEVVCECYGAIKGDFDTLVA